MYISIFKYVYTCIHVYASKHTCTFTYIYNSLASYGFIGHNPPVERERGREGERERGREGEREQERVRTHARVCARTYAHTLRKEEPREREREQEGRQKGQRDRSANETEIKGARECVCAHANSDTYEKRPTKEANMNRDLQKRPICIEET